MSRMGFVIALLFATRAMFAAETYQFNYENVLGTSLELKIRSESVEAAREAEVAVLAEIDRLCAIYSTYDSKSEIRQWLDGDRVAGSFSPELIELLKVSEATKQASNGAFDVAVGDAISLWKQAAKSNREPSEDELRMASSNTRPAPWKWNEASTTAERIGTAKLTFDGIATGLIVDRACEKALAVTGVHGVLLNIGGDLRIAGDLVEAISIANPQSPDKALTSELANLDLRDRAMTTSGNYQRGFQVGTKWYSHIIDPRTAEPVQHVLSATVIAKTAVDADAWATAFSVMTPDESVEHCRRNPSLACLLVLENGAIVSSHNWPARSVLTSFVDDTKKIETKTAEAVEWNPGAELKLEFEINRAGGNRYRRPYIAAWVEDKDQFPVRTLVLWMQTDEPGPRWHRDLKRWYKQDTLRRLVDDKKLIGTVSAATKPPGAYKIAWDGKDDAGKLVSKGTYTLFIEAAREHGTYQILSKEFTVGDDEVKVDLGKNEEIKSAKFEYLPRGAAK